MRPLPFSLSLLLCAALGSVASAAPASECSALHAEVETLRAKVRAFEASALPIPQARTEAALPGTAAKPAAVATLVVEEPYSRTGCSQGLFKGIPDARWQDPELWLELDKGQSPAKVEKLLGVEHYDERGGGNVIWHYGRCGASSRAQVLFTDGKLSDWRAPSAR